MELREMKGGGQSWGHIGVSPIWKSQPCYQGGSSTAGGINVKFWAGTRRGQSFEDICTLQEELEEREIRAHYRGKGRTEGGRKGGTDFVLLSRELVSCKFLQHKMKNCICDFASLCPAPTFKHIVVL